MATISQRISLEGSEELQKQLVALGQAGAQAFQQIQKAAEKPIADPAQIQKTKEAVDGLVTSAQSLAKQFQPLNDNVKQFGAAGTQATQQVTAGLNQTSTAAQQAGGTIQRAGQDAATAGENAGSSLLSASRVFGIAAAGIVAAMSAIVSSLTKGAAETSKEVSDQAGKLNLTIPQMQQLRTAVQGTSLANKEFAGSLSKVSDLMQKGAGGAQFLAGSLRQQTIAVKDGFVTISAFGMRAKDRAFQLKNEAHKAATELRKLGASGEAIATGDTIRGMREIAANIDRQTDATKQAQLGNKAFGDSWRETTDALIQSVLPIDKSTASLAELGKMNRQLSAGDVGLGKDFLKQTGELSNAVKAVKDQVGALFLGPATTKAKWLTDLVDGAAELFRQFSRLDAFSREDFLAGLSAGPAQTAFKILVALGQQLAAIWTNVLVPAGRQVVSIVRQITGNLEGTSTAQVAAGFITLAAAVIGLSLALRLAGVALGPLSLLFSVFSGFGPVLLVLAGLVVLFWSQFKSAAETALSWIPGSLQRFQRALQALLSGDFTSAWILFSGTAGIAFDTIIMRIGETKGVLGDFIRMLTGQAVQIPWMVELRDGLKRIGEELPGTIEFIIGAVIGLGKAFLWVSEILGKFGINISPTTLAAVLIILQFTGGLQILAAIAIIAANGLTFLVTVLGVGWKLFQGLAFVVGRVAVGLRFAALAVVGMSAGFAALPFVIGAAIVALGALVIALIALNWNRLKADAGAAWDWVKRKVLEAKAAVLDFVTSLPSDIWEGIKAGAAEAWDWVKQKVSEAKAAVLDFVTSLPSDIWEGIKAGAAEAWDWVKQKVSEAKAAVLDFVTSLPSDIWEGIKAGAAEAWDWVKQKVSEAKAAVLDFVTSLPSSIWEGFKAAGVVAWDAITTAIERAIAAVKNFFAVGGPDVGSPTPVGAHRFAHGGLVGGRGTGMSDSNLAWLSRGEHIMPARAVGQPGVLAFLEALRRSGGDLSRVIDRMGHFALGGLVPRPMAIPAFASGGLVGGNNVTIQFPGLPPISGLRASSDVVDELRKAAVLAQVRSGGRKPSRYS